MKRGQVAMEFLMLIGLSIVMLLVFLTSVDIVSRQKTDEKTFYELDDLGVTIQKEIILASELENGYRRNIDIPQTVNGRNYVLDSGNASAYTAYISITFEGRELFYHIPLINGTPTKGKNIITKFNGTVSIY